MRRGAGSHLQMETTPTPSPTRAERFLRARIDFCILGVPLGTGHLVRKARAAATAPAPATAATASLLPPRGGTEREQTHPCPRGGGAPYVRLYDEQAYLPPPYVEVLTSETLGPAGQ